MKLKSNWLNWKRKVTERKDFTHLSSKQLIESKKQLYRIAQIESYPTEYQNLSNNKPIPIRSKLIPLRPIMVDGLIRVGGRIGLAHVAYESKHQVILSPKHYISTLIVLHIHTTNFHVGRNLTIALTREKIWITSA